MDPVWQQCPFEILRCIMKESPDLATKEAWCVATKGSSELQRFALRIRWDAAVLKHYDLIEAPNGTLRWPKVFSKKFVKEPEPSTAITSFVQFLATAESSSSSCAPATFVRHLCIDFQNLTEDDCSDYEDFEAWCGSMPHVDSLRLSFKKFFPFFSHLCQVQHLGCLGQGAFDSIVDGLVALSSKHNCERLVLRDGIMPPQRFRSNIIMDPIHSIGWVDGEMNVDWQGLARLAFLRDLTIKELTHDEGPSLANSLEHLTSLRRLSISTAGPLSKNVNHYSTGGLVSPMKAFLEAAFSSQIAETSFCKLPDGLERLTLYDTWWTPGGYQDPLVIDHSLFAKSKITSLKELRLDFHLPDLVSSLVSCFSPSRIVHLAIPAGRFMNWNEEVMVEADPTALKLILDSILYFKDSLQTVTLMDAWSCHFDLVDFLNDNLKGHGFAVEDLILATRPEFFYENLFGQFEDSVSENHLWKNIYGYRGSDSDSRWGSSLLRIRLEQVELYDLRYEDLWNSHLANLRALVIYPWKLPSREQKLTEDVAGSPEGDLALRILGEQSPRSLRVFVVGGFRFWIERNDSTDPKDSMYSEVAKIWHFESARDDAVQRAQMKHCLNDHDWAFLMDVPSAGYHTPRVGKPKGWPSEPRPLFSRRGNRLVIRRRSDVCKRIN